MARTYDYNTQRSQDYLLGGMGEQQQQSQPQAPKTAYFSSASSPVFGGAKRQTPDLARQSFRARERQITENVARPLDLSFIDREKERAASDIREKGTKQLESIAAKSRNLSDYLPDLSKAILSSDQTAMDIVGQRLAAPTTQIATENVSTALDDQLLNYLQNTNKGTYQDILTRSRGGGLLGANRLDAAILARSAFAPEMLNQKRREVASLAQTEGNFNRTIEAEKKLAEKRYGDVTNQIRDYLDTISGATLQGIEATRGRYRTRDIGKEAQRAKQEAIATIANQQPNLVPFLQSVNPKDLERFVSRELTREQATSAKQAEILNNIAKLTGSGQTFGTGAAGVGYDQNALLEYLRKFGTQKLTEKQAADKAAAAQREAARIAAEEKARKAKEEEAKNVRLGQILGAPKTPSQFQSPYLPKNAGNPVILQDNRPRGVDNNRTIAEKLLIPQAVPLLPAAMASKVKFNRLWK